MPTPDDTTRPSRRQPTLRTVMRDLDRAHASATPSQADPGEVMVRFGTTEAAIVLIGEPGPVRQLLSDAIAQLDAMEAGR